MCPTFSWRQSHWGQNINKKSSKLILSLFFKVFFVNRCHFRDTFIGTSFKVKNILCQGNTTSHLIYIFLADPGKALRRRHAQTVRDTSSSYKIDYVIVIKNFLNPEGHQNPINGLKVTAILRKGWILPIDGASAVEGLRSTGLLRLVFVCLVEYTPSFAERRPKHTCLIMSVDLKY